MSQDEWEEWRKRVRKRRLNEDISDFLCFDFFRVCFVFDLRFSCLYRCTRNTKHETPGFRSCS